MGSTAGGRFRLRVRRLRRLGGDAPASGDRGGWAGRDWPRHRPSSRLHEQQRHLYLSGIRALVAAVDARDPSARGHSDRVASYSRRIAQAMGMTPEWVEKVYLAGLLHDVGKIGIADSVLRKPGPLEPAERAVMMAHAEISAQIVGADPDLADLVPLVRHHHEWHSGGGYPQGLAGDAIPLGAAIISVADAFDTMTTGRPYRPAVSLEEAVAELKRASGTQFRPEVVDAFLRALAEDERTGREYVRELKLRSQPAERVGPTSGPGPEEARLPGASAESEAGRACASPVARITPLQARELAALCRMAQVVRDVLDLPTLLQRVLDIIGSEFSMPDAGIYLVDDETGELVLACATGAMAAFQGKRLKPGEGVNGWVLTRGEPVLVPDVRQEPRCQPGPPGTRSQVVVPLASGGRVLGTLAVDSPHLDAFSVEAMQALTTVAQQAAMAIEAARLHEQVRRAALRDGLTDLFNHRHFYERLHEELERAARYGYGLQVALADVDGMKAVNDNLGHVAGDAVLVEMARVLRRHCRRYDVLARHGGDEFGILMPQADRQGALVAIARLDQALREATFDWYGYRMPLPTVSWGLAGFPEDGRRAGELVAAADARMYQAKRERQFEAAGRSLVVQELQPPRYGHVAPGSPA